MVQRLESISYGNTKVHYPEFFPSISSVKVNFPVYDCLKILSKTQEARFLISSYDIYNIGNGQKEEIIDTLFKLKQSGVTILLDSGKYESYWHQDNKWSIDKYEQILQYDICSFCFSFDCQDIEHKNKKGLIDIILKNYFSNLNKTNVSVIPIIHSNLADMPSICAEVIKETKAKSIAIPERLLGDGILARYENLKNLRFYLNDTLDYYEPIHVLGTGNPFSILILSFAGGDTFDGLEWCQTSIDPKTYQVYHFQLRDLFDITEKEFKDYSLNNLCKNLLAYRQINNEIRGAFMDNKIASLLKDRLPQQIWSKILGA